MNQVKERDGQSKTQRRRFLSALGAAGTGLVTAIAGVKTLESNHAEAAPLPPVLADANGNLMVRMQQELEQAIASGRTPGWLMVVDTRKCIGCDSCTLACRAENPTGPAGGFRRVVQIRLTPSTRPISIFKPSNCLQCDDPPCMRAVPQGMITKRPDGIVEFNHKQLKGSYAAAAAYPVKAIHIDDGKTFTQDTPAPQAYEERRFVENGVEYTRKPSANPLQNAARKCTFCSHLIEAGVLPAYVTTCIGGAMYFGDGNDPGSLVNEITQGRRRFPGHEFLGLKPRVIYPRRATC